MKIKEQERGLFVSVISLILLLKQVHFGKYALELDLPRVNGSHAVGGGGLQILQGSLIKSYWSPVGNTWYFTAYNGLNMWVLLLCVLDFICRTGINP